MAQINCFLHQNRMDSSDQMVDTNPMSWLNTLYTMAATTTTMINPTKVTANVTRVFSREYWWTSRMAINKHSAVQM